MRFILLFSFSFLFITFSKASGDKIDIIVKLKSDSSPYHLFRPTMNKTSNLIQPINYKVLKSVSKSMNLWELEINSDLSYSELISILSTNQDIIAFERVKPVYYRGFTPNDQFFPSQWNLLNTGQAGGNPGADIKATLAWDSNNNITNSQGDTLVIAVIDKPIDSSISQINWFINRNEIPNNSIDDDANGYIDDYRGWNTYDDNGIVFDFIGAKHGTQVSSIIGAKMNDNIGIAGIHSNVKILPIYGDDVFNTANVIQAYDYAIEMKKLYLQSNKTKGAFIVATNNSFGIDGDWAIDHPIWCAMYDSMGKYGILSVTATTNSFANIDVIGDMPTTCQSNFLIAVSSSNFQDQSSRGYGKINIDIHAPGESIYSISPGNIIETPSGTSMATPHVAGAISFLYSKASDSLTLAYYNDMPNTSLKLKKVILDGADSIPSLFNKSTTGGRLNLYKSLIKVNDFYQKPISNLSFPSTKIELRQENSILKILNITESVNIKMFNIEGKMLYNKTRNEDSEISIDCLPAQLYFIQINDLNGNIFTFKFNNNKK